MTPNSPNEKAGELDLDAIEQRAIVPLPPAWCNDLGNDLRDYLKYTSALIPALIAEIRRLRSSPDARVSVGEITVEMLSVLLEEDLSRGDYRHLIGRWTPRVKAMLAAAPQTQSPMTGEETKP